MPKLTATLELSDAQASALEQLGAMAGASPAEILLALAVDRLAMNLVHADSPEGELRALLWQACGAGQAEVNAEWGVQPAEVSHA